MAGARPFALVRRAHVLVENLRPRGAGQAGVRLYAMNPALVVLPIHGALGNRFLATLRTCTHSSDEAMTVASATLANLFDAGN